MTDIENVQTEDIPVDNESVAVSEEMLPKSVVSKIVERERLKATEQERKRLMEQMQNQQPAPEHPAQQPQGQQVGLGGMSQLSQDDIQRLIAEHAPQALMQHVNQLKVQHTVDTFVNKMNAAEQKYPGLQEKLGELDYDGMAPIIEMANSMENTADIMKELVDNPMKMGNLMALMYSQPKMAKKAMMDLSSSIKTNQQALEEEKQARDPMSSLKPSTKAGIDNGEMSVSDFRKMFRR